MKKRFTFYFSVTTKNKSQELFSFSNKKSLKKISAMLSYSLNKSLKSPNQACINEIFKLTN
ncbi:MAG: hypothetical protein L3J56_07215 [Bacteroidales bacterium]|nr:hypothetical protein [Bacteroidales bacterium]